MSEGERWLITKLATIVSDARSDRPSFHGVHDKSVYEASRSRRYCDNGHSRWTTFYIGPSSRINKLYKYYATVLFDPVSDDERIFLRWSFEPDGKYGVQVYKNELPFGNENWIVATKRQMKFADLVIAGRSVNKRIKSR